MKDMPSPGGKKQNTDDKETVLYGRPSRNASYTENTKDINVRHFKEAQPISRNPRRSPENDENYAYNYRLNKEKIRRENSPKHKEAQFVPDSSAKSYRETEAYVRNFGDPAENRAREIARSSKAPQPKIGKTETIRTQQEEEYMHSKSSDAYDTQKITVPRQPQRRKRQTRRTSPKSPQNNNLHKNPRQRQRIQQNQPRQLRQPQPTPKKYNKPPRQKKHTGGKIFRRILAVVIVLFIIYSLIALFAIIRMNRVNDGERTRNGSAEYSTSVTNVLLIGSDTRDPSEDSGRSDSIMLASLNSHTHKLWLTSFLRDAYVSIPGYGSGKLNASYAYGGADLLMDTIELNYNIRIDNYIMVSFKGFADIIDSVGGVKVTMDDDEANALNIILQSEVNSLMGDDVNDDLLSGGGTYHLDGKQALSYTRIRYAGNADFDRTERQRTVMNQVFKKLRTMNPVYLTRLLATAMPETTTNMDTLQMYLLSLRVPTMLIYSTKQQQIPADGTFSGTDMNGESVLQVDFDSNIEILEDTVLK